MEKGKDPTRTVFEGFLQRGCVSGDRGGTLGGRSVCTTFSAEINPGELGKGSQEREAWRDRQVAYAAY